MNTAAIFAFVFEYGTIPLIAGLLIATGWFAYDEIQKATNAVENK